MTAGNGDHSMALHHFMDDSVGLLKLQPELPDVVGKKLKRLRQCFVSLVNGRVNSCPINLVQLRAASTGPTKADAPGEWIGASGVE